jgi:hypothetical protein
MFLNWRDANSAQSAATASDPGTDYSRDFNAKRRFGLWNFLALLWHSIACTRSVLLHWPCWKKAHIACRPRPANARVFELLIKMNATVRPPLVPLQTTYWTFYRGRARGKREGLERPDPAFRFLHVKHADFASPQRCCFLRCHSWDRVETRPSWSPASLRWGHQTVEAPSASGRSIPREQ